MDANGSVTVLNTYSYAFDVADRMTQKTENGVSTTYGYDKLGQVTQDGATAYTYDDEGNRTTAGNGWTYGFDDLGQVTSKMQGGTTWTYQYQYDFARADDAGVERLNDANMTPFLLTDGQSRRLRFRLVKLQDGNPVADASGS